MTSHSLVSAETGYSLDARRSTLDPSDVVGLLSADSSQEANTNHRRSTLNPSEALSILSETAGLHSNSSIGRRDTMDPRDVSQLTGTNDERRETLDPSELLAKKGDYSSDEEEVLGAFRKTSDESKDGFEVGDFSIVDSERDLSFVEDKEVDAELGLKTSSNQNQNENSRKRTPQRVAKFTSPTPKSLISPPLTRKQPTPLKSCLSARKPKKASTPTKSVVFGSPRASEFRINDPSTSVTPMCNRQAKEMFPLDKIDSDEDEVTSENTSILDEADHLLDENDSISFPFGSMRSPNRSKRMSNVKGVSPLDNIADARRKRRSSFGSRQENTISKRQSLLGVNVMQNNNSFVAGSATKRPSAKDATGDSSSDEDMEITGDYSNVAAPRPRELSNGLGDLWNENYTPPKSMEVDDESSEEDQTLDLGPIGSLKGDSTLFSRSSVDSQIPVKDNDTSNFRDLNALHPIVEEEETSSNHNSSISQMSVSSDEEDEDYDAQRESVVINLGNKFEKIGSSSKKKRQSIAPEAIAVSPGTHHENGAQSELSPSSSIPPRLSESPSENLENVSGIMEDDVEVEGVAFATILDKLNLEELRNTIHTSVVESSILMSISSVLAQKKTWTEAHQDLSSWLAELAPDAETLMRKNAPKYLARMYHADELQTHAQLKTLYETHINSILSGWYTWRLKAESAENWRKPRATVENDLNLLQSHRVGRKEKHDRQVVQQLLKKEAEMERALESIQEQQSIRSEYANRIKILESKNEALKLQLSKHGQQMELHKKELESTAVISDSSMHQRLSLVQEKDELFQISGRLSKWKCRNLSRDSLEFFMECKSTNLSEAISISVKVDLRSSEPALSVQATSVNSKKHSTFGDIAALVRLTMFDPKIVEKMGAKNVRSVQELGGFLQLSEVELTRANRLWNDIENLTLHYSISTGPNNHISIVFVSFKSLVKLRIGLPIMTQFYFSQCQPTIDVEFGSSKVVIQDLKRKIQGVKKGFRRLHGICECVEAYVQSLEHL
ncbi:Aste57867_18104 [Aphanomyces stellatus]|uniref:Aste57867_18104 protein n=1 Tax=Aphanomyces stellatus TaxID=120398 RepID=A0A485LCX0_9STRA|nr:hypothetical protein As57867_018042 [Aphanomyces stellatus]VFT94842.1 Aste57867_18104 [Aphanomyces stellatus]